MTTHAQEIDRYRKQTTKSHAMYEQADKVLPLGVSSNFRTFEPYPIYIARAEGSKMWDVDGREYTDFSMCFGALMVGHANPVMVKAVAKAAAEGTLYGMPHDRELKAAELICERFGLGQMRFTNSGSESTMHCLRLARVYTGRDKVLKFEGAYHGGHDTALVSVKPPKAKLGSARHPKPLPVGHGIPDGTVKNTVVAQWNDIQSVRDVLQRNDNEVAAVILEPIMMNVGVIGPRDGFLEELREICDEFGCLLIFDEVKTGAKLAWGGAQEYYDVKADMVCLAKAIGGGLPLGAFGASREVMNEIAAFRSFHAGTYASNPLATSACITALDKVLTKDVFKRVTRLGDMLAAGHNRIIKKHGLAACSVNIGANGTVFWRRKPPTNYREWLDQDFDAFWRYWHMNLNRGVIPQAQCYDEQWTVSAVHTEKDVDHMLEVFDEVARAMK
ncbi:MAG TPA: glutamate-1-semialdehyde 2,1-aminomutase [Vicinamibacteria bacterium]|nr:glutamate-1-semialdehyde 2,1-aminomutase [Vicinamibacteria bacterium]